MTKEDKKRYLNKRIIGVWEYSDITIALKDMGYINNMYKLVVEEYNSSFTLSVIHVLKLYTRYLKDGREHSYIVLKGKKLYINQCNICSY